MLSSRNKILRTLVLFMLFLMVLTVFTEETAEAARRRRGGQGRRNVFGRNFNPSRGRQAMVRRNQNRNRNRNQVVARQRNQNLNRNLFDNRRNQLGGTGLILGDNQVDAFSSLAIDPTGQRFQNQDLVLVDRNIAVDRNGRAFLVDPSNLNRDRELTVFQDQILGGSRDFALSGDLAVQAQRVNRVGVSRAGSSLRGFSNRF